MDKVYGLCQYQLPGCDVVVLQLCKKLDKRHRISWYYFIKLHFESTIISK